MVPRVYQFIKEFRRRKSLGILLYSDACEFHVSLSSRWKPRAQHLMYSGILLDIQGSECNLNNNFFIDGYFLCGINCGCYIESSS